MTGDFNPILLVKTGEGYLEQATRHKIENDDRLAKRNLLSAAAYFFFAARLSGNPLKQQYFQRGEWCIEQAKSVQVRTKKIPNHRENEDESNMGSFLMQEKPEITLDDVAGLDDVKEKLRRFCKRRTPELLEKWKVKLGGGILLFGPPGVGKTFIAKATAGEYDAAFFAIDPSRIMSKWVGESEKRIADLFAEARARAQEYERAIIFIDEVDSLFPGRDNQSSTIMARVVPQFLMEMDGAMGENSNMLVIGTTNIPWAIDSAFLRSKRFDYKIYIPPPDFDARYRLFELNLDVPRSDDFDFSVLASMTEGYSGADIAKICEIARNIMYDREEANIAETLTTDVVIEAKYEIQPSIRQSDLKRFEKFMKEWNL